MRPDIRSSARATLATVQEFGGNFAAGSSQDVRIEMPSRAGVHETDPGRPLPSPRVPSWVWLAVAVLAVAYL